MFCNDLKAGRYNKGWQGATKMDYISSQLQGPLSNSHSDQILRRDMVLNMQHRAEGQPPAFYGRSPKLVEYFSSTDQDRDQLCCRRHQHRHTFLLHFLVYSYLCNNQLQRYQHGYLNAKCHTPNVLQVTQTRVGSHSHWSMSSGKTLIHGSAALTPVCPVYSGAFCPDPGAVDPCFKLHHPQQQADGLTAPCSICFPSSNHTVKQARELLQIRNTEPAFSQSDPFCSASCC